MRTPETDTTGDGLPTAGALASLLGEGASAQLAAILEPVLVEPARELVQRPSKQLRAQLVAAGFDLAAEGAAASAGDRARLARCAQAIELLHAGSLIVDDIQDGSAVRRGGPAVHLRYGVSGALCTGNWLYFWPLRVIRSLELPLWRENLAFRLYHDALERAHYGQALDVSIRIDQIERARVAALCDGVAALKTGALTGLAMMLGAVIAGADEPRILALGAFGGAFGGALQRCDDVGNALGRVDPEKRFEDLVQRKPSWLWGLAATHKDAAFYDEFRRRAAGLPDAGDEFARWLAGTGLGERARSEAVQGLDEAFAALAEAWGLAPENESLGALQRLGGRLIHAYT